MMARHQLEDDQPTWHRSVRELSDLLRNIPSENCTGAVGKYDHSWNAELRLVVDEGVMDLEKGLRLGEFPSMVQGGL